MMGDADRRVRLGRVLGFIFITGGFVVIGKAWDGAANRNFITGQFPYLLSGGFMGLGLIVTGSTMLFLATVRAERQIVTEKLDETLKLLGRNLARLGYSSNGSGPSDQVVAGASAYHRPGCRILEGKDGLMSVPVEQAVAEGLAACRVCDPPRPPGAEAEPQETPEAAAQQPGAADEVAPVTPATEAPAP